jgi:hypothetical protein
MMLTSYFYHVRMTNTILLCHDKYSIQYYFEMTITILFYIHIKLLFVTHDAALLLAG